MWDGCGIDIDCGHGERRGGGAGDSRQYSVQQGRE